MTWKSLNKKTQKIIVRKYFLYSTAVIPPDGSIFTTNMAGLQPNTYTMAYVPTDLQGHIDKLKKANQSGEFGRCDMVEQCLYDYIATNSNISRGVSAITERMKMLELRRHIGEVFSPKMVLLFVTPHHQMRHKSEI